MVDPEERRREVEIKERGAIRVEGDAKLEFVRQGKKCCMKFLEVRVRRPLPAVSAIVDGGSKVVLGQQES